MADKLNFYETLYLVRPDLEDAGLSVIREKLAGALRDNKGETIRDEKWDERNLAYEIQGYRRGAYHILTYKALPGVVSAIEKHLGFHKSEVMRFMTVSVDEDQARGKEPEKPPAEERKKDSSHGGEERRDRDARRKRGADSDAGGMQGFKAPDSAARNETTKPFQAPKPASANNDGEKKQ